MRQGDLVGRIASDGGGAFRDFETIQALAGFVDDGNPVCSGGLHTRLILFKRAFMLRLIITDELLITKS